MRWIDQVENLILLKQENPNLRIRNAEQLGPAIKVAMQQKVESTVKGPAVYCVDPDAYERLCSTPASTDNIALENIDGVMKSMVP